MDDNNQKQEAEEKKKVTAKVTCPHCGKDFDAEVEVPASADSPKMTWQT